MARRAVSQCAKCGTFLTAGSQRTHGNGRYDSQCKFCDADQETRERRKAAYGLAWVKSVISQSARLRPDLFDELVAWFIGYAKQRKAQEEARAERQRAAAAAAPKPTPNPVPEANGKGVLIDARTLEQLVTHAIERALKRREVQPELPFTTSVSR